MLDYLTAHPDKGLLAYQMGFPTTVQYWRSLEHLEAFAEAGRLVPVGQSSSTRERLSVPV